MEPTGITREEVQQLIEKAVIAFCLIVMTGIIVFLLIGMAEAGEPELSRISQAERDIVFNRALTRGNTTRIDSNRGRVLTLEEALDSHIGHSASTEDVTRDLNLAQDQFMHELNELDTELTAAIAGAYALQNIPLPANSTYNVGVGAGFYKDQSALAIGGMGRTRSFYYQGGVVYGETGQVGGGAGIGFSF